MTARIARTSCLLAVVASLLVLSPATARAAPTLPGIDVSQWQQTIDWSKVAGAGMRFAIARATKGQHYIDPTFQTNVDGARAEGIVVGAYHRATPSGGANANTTDARAEADPLPRRGVPRCRRPDPRARHRGDGWPRAARPRGVGEGMGDAGDEPPRRETDAVREPELLDGSTWATGTWFADHGYRLWLAHWNVSSPTVPANGWQGRGWTFWQWTHKPGMPGVTTDLDRDRFDGTNLVTARIARLTAVPGAGGSVTDVTRRLSCGDGASCAALFDPSAIVTLTATPDPGAVFLRGAGSRPDPRRPAW